jgi:GTP cyclohydrolase II
MKTSKTNQLQRVEVERQALFSLDIEGHDFGSNGHQSIRDTDSEVTFVAQAKLPTRYGEFVIAGFRSTKGGKEHTALIKGEVSGKQAVPLRIHSECHTGDVFGSMKCDCRDQLEASLKYIASKPCGVLIYLRQEGRGIGLLNKIKAYHLQDLGLDTIEANESLGFPCDLREYGDAAKILTILQIESVALLTNNPDKIAGLEQEGIDVSSRIPLHIPPNDHNRRYLTTKIEKMGHLF